MRYSVVVTPDTVPWAATASVVGTMVVLVLVPGAGIGSFGMSLAGTGATEPPQQLTATGAQHETGAVQPWHEFLWNKPPPNSFFLPLQEQLQLGAAVAWQEELHPLHLWPKSVDSAPPLNAIIKTTLYI
jgi:hypothetical protein